MQNLLDETVLHGITDTLPVGIMILRRGRVVDVNRCLADWFRHARDDFLGLDAQRAEALGLAPLLGDGDDITVAGGDRERRLHRWRAGLPDGSEALIFEDVTQLAEVLQDRDRWRARAEALEARDPETGQLSRAAILSCLDGQVSHARRYGNPLAVVRLSLKPLAGNAVLPALKTFAEELRADLRWADQIGRYGEAALLLVLPETALPAARSLAASLGRTRARWPGLDDFALDVAVAGWEKGDDARKLLRRLERDAMWG